MTKEELISQWKEGDVIVEANRDRNIRHPHIATYEVAFNDEYNRLMLKQIGASCWSDPLEWFTYLIKKEVTNEIHRRTKRDYITLSAIQQSALLV